MEENAIKKQNTPDEAIKLEREIYRACLKQVVAVLNTTLPPLSDSEEEIEKQPEPKKQKATEEKEEECGKNSYRLRDVTPTRIMKEVAKPSSKAPENQKKRIKSLAIGNKNKSAREYTKNNKKRFKSK